MPSRPTAKMRAVKKAATPRTAAPTQIAAVSNSYGEGKVVEAVIVLMDDGTIWRYPTLVMQSENQVWTQLPAVGTAPSATSTPKE